MNLVIHQVIFCKDSDSFCFCKMDAKKRVPLRAPPPNLNYYYNNYSIAASAAVVGQYGFWYVNAVSTLSSGDVMVKSLTPSGAK